MAPFPESNSYQGLAGSDVLNSSWRASHWYVMQITEVRREIANEVIDYLASLIM